MERKIVLYTCLDDMYTFYAHIVGAQRLHYRSVFSLTEAKAKLTYSEY